MRNTLLPVFAVLVLLCSGCAQKARDAPATAAKSPPEEDAMKNTPAKLVVSSPAFSDNSLIPETYTCDAENINPPLSLTGIPAGAKTLVLIVDDPDAPSGVWDHWVVWNVEPAAQIKENSVPPGGVQGVASDGRNAYHGPCPPSGTHRYRFKVYALDSSIDLSAKSKKKDVEKAMERRILAQGMVTGLYGKK